MTHRPTARIAAIERATGGPWDDGLRFMEGIGAAQVDHHRIAIKVFEELDGSMDQSAGGRRR